jgi:hypothetical protein
MKRISVRALAAFCILCSALLVPCLPGKAWAWSGVSTDKNVYSPGEQIRVRFSGAPGYNSDWICIVPSGEPDTAAGTYQYLPYGVRQGFVTFIAPSPGRYQVRAYYDYRRNGYLVSARRSFTVAGQEGSTESTRNENRYVGPGGAWVATDKNVYFQGEHIQVRFSGAPGYSSDWICIVPYRAPENEAGDFKYMPDGMKQGELTFSARAPGRYEVRAYFNYRRNGYLVSARYSFIVKNRWSSRGERYQEDNSQPTYPGQTSMPPDPKLRQAQYRLMELGYDPGVADGLYGKKTRRALLQFQRDNQLRQSGDLDRMTLKALGLLKEMPNHESALKDGS